MHPSLEDIQEAFLAAMSTGWVAGAEEHLGTCFPGQKLIYREYGNFHVTDNFLPSESADGYSAGWTVICHLDIPVWQMHYEGRYAKAAIPYLKHSLHRAYASERRFYGGRGPGLVRGDRFTYTNHFEGSFARFSGVEYIHDLNELSLGYHSYRGGALLNIHRDLA